MRKTQAARVLSSFGLTQAEIAEAIGLSQPSVHRKLHGLQEWTGSEIEAVLDLVRKQRPDARYEDVFGRKVAA